jgi:protein MpaA
MLLCLPVMLILPSSLASAGNLVPEGPDTPEATSSAASDSGLKSQVIGFSVEERPLVVYQVGQGDRKRMIVAGIHGGYEWNTIALANRLTGFLEKNPGLVPKDMTLYVLPALNPDGAARSHGYEGRANSNGVDLNRNFPARWKADWAQRGCWDFLPITSGDHPFSEPESQAIAKFLLREHVEALISYHSASLGIFAGGRPTDPGSVSLAEGISLVTDYPYPPIETGCDYSGNLTDWAAANGIDAVDIELTTHDSIDYEINLRVLLTFLSWRP